MTEWLVPDRFVQVVHAWERLGLPDVGIVYHRLHITVDSKHAMGWFHNVVRPPPRRRRQPRHLPLAYRRTSFTDGGAVTAERQPALAEA